MEKDAKPIVSLLAESSVWIFYAFRKYPHFHLWNLWIGFKLKTNRRAATGASLYSNDSHNKVRKKTQCETTIF